MPFIQPDPLRDFDCEDVERPKAVTPDMHILRFVLVLFGVLFGVLLVAVLCGGCSSAKTAGTLAVKASKPAPSMVTFVVTGGKANVLYGPSNNTKDVTGLMRVSMPVSGNHGFTMTTELNKPGKTTCQIQIDGKTVDMDTSSDAALCSVFWNPVTGKWDNS
jgi:hypothetical protein